VYFGHKTILNKRLWLFNCSFCGLYVRHHVRLRVRRIWVINQALREELKTG